MKTTFESKCSILAELWTNFKEDAEYAELFSYNDLGFPIANLIDSDIVSIKKGKEFFVDETFEQLLSGYKLSDTGFKSLKELFDTVEEREA